MNDKLKAGLAIPFSIIWTGLCATVIDDFCKRISHNESWGVVVYMVIVSAPLWLSLIVLGLIEAGVFVRPKSEEL